jgi:hypothetical protein
VCSVATTLLSHSTSEQNSGRGWAVTKEKYFIRNGIIIIIAYTVPLSKTLGQQNI